MSMRGGTIALVVMVAMMGCARVRSPPALGAAPIVLPTSGADPVPFEAALQRRFAGLASFRAQGVLRLERGSAPVWQTGFMLVASGESNLRLRGKRALGPTLFEVIANADRFAFSIPTRRQWYEGVLGDGASREVRPVPGSVVDPLRVKLRPDGTRIVVHDPAGPRVVELAPGVDGDAGGIVQTIEFARETGRPARVLTYDAEGGLVQITTFGDYQQLPGTGPDDAFPFHLRVERPQAPLVLTFTFRTVVPNVAVPPAAFDLTPPADYEVLPAAAFDPIHLESKPDAHPSP